MQEQNFIDKIQENSLYVRIEDYLSNPVVQLILIIFTVWVFKKFGMLIIKRTVRRTVRGHHYSSASDEKKREDTIIEIIDAAMKVLVWAIAGMFTLSALGFDTAPLLAGASIAGVALGFGLQSLIKDFVSGLFIIMENQYRVGDIIKIADVSGVVEDISMRVTTLRDLDGHRHYIPNGEISVATNMSMEFSNVKIKLGVSYDADLDKVKEIINKVGVDLAKNKDFTEAIIEPPKFVRVDNFAASEVTVLVLGKVKAGEQWRTAGEFRLQVKKAFDKAKIEIPFQQVVVHKAK